MEGDLGGGGKGSLRWKMTDVVRGSVRARGNACRAEYLAAVSRLADWVFMLRMYHER